MVESFRDTLGLLNELYLVQIAGNSSILELKSHVNLTSGGYHVEYWSHQNVTKESHNQIQNCHYRGRHRGHTNYLYTYTITSLSFLLRDCHFYYVIAILMMIT